MRKNFLFNEIVTEIKQEAKYNSNNLGWRFLVNSKDTLINNNGIYLITLNPGGDKVIPEHGVESCENGSAYLNEVWDGFKPGESPLQIQFKLMFKKISEFLKEPDYKSVLENALVGQFIPFRSPNINCLKDKNRSIKFAEKIWEKVLINSSGIRLIIVIDKLTLKSMFEIFKKNSFVILSEEKLKVGWGDYSAYIYKIKKEGKEFYLVRFPHLSRFKIFGREKSEPFINNIFNIILNPTGTPNS